MLKPLQDKLLVKMNKAEDTIGGVIIPEISKKYQNWGKVLSCGKECNNLSPGDEVMVASTQGTYWREAGEDLIVLSERDVLCKRLTA